MGFRAVGKDVDCTMAETAEHLSSSILRILDAVISERKTVREKRKQSFP